MIRTWRKKPVEIEAVQWTGSNTTEIEDFIGALETIAYDWPGDGQSGARVVIETLEGTMFASPADWIIKGVKGELYPCKPDIFEATYEPVEP